MPYKSFTSNILYNFLGCYKLPTELTSGRVARSINRLMLKCKTSARTTTAPLNLQRKQALGDLRGFGFAE